MPEKVWGRLLNERIMNITDKSADNEQRNLQKERGYVDQIMALKTEDKSP